ncbi:hypothetical protein Ccrd_020655 [Cynara cardunculus var. scolymus]|uniref:Uncharacterized protein n=1 Tax=Cynara cardunculus var. scolymus TaxID=59895 RepID=A0A103Y220_CYNCS|nr:hypothetical protein Ccrd_020655 [Cynara cardunculus var. scolymus]
MHINTPVRLLLKSPLNGYPSLPLLRSRSATDCECIPYSERQSFVNSTIGDAKTNAPACLERACNDGFWCWCCTTTAKCYYEEYICKDNCH